MPRFLTVFRHSELVSESMLCLSFIFNLTFCRVGDYNQGEAKHFNLASCRNSSLKLGPVGIHASTSSRCETVFRSLVTPIAPIITFIVQNTRCEARLFLRKVKWAILTVVKNIEERTRHEGTSMYKHGLARIHASALLINSLFSGCDKREGELPAGFVFWFEQYKTWTHCFF